MDKETWELVFVGLFVVAALILPVVEARRRRRRKEARRLARENRLGGPRGPLVSSCGGCGSEFPAEERICPHCGQSRMSTRISRRDRAWRNETALGYGGARGDAIGNLQDALPPARWKRKRRKPPKEE